MENSESHEFYLLEIYIPEDGQEVQDEGEGGDLRGVPEKSGHISDLDFATALRRFGSVLLLKSQTPQMKKKKSDAVKEIAMHFLVEKGIDLTLKQIVKKVNNMKFRIKSKTDKKATGNRKIVLNPGERIIYELLGAGENPAVAKVTYGIAVGADKRALKERNNNTTSDDVQNMSQLSVGIAPEQKKSPLLRVNSQEPGQNLTGSPYLDTTATSRPPKFKRLNKRNGTRPSEPRSEHENLSAVQFQRMVLIKQLEALDQQVRINEKLELVLDKANGFLDRYNSE